MLRLRVEPEKLMNTICFCDLEKSIMDIKKL
jgi:hypothetical protein